MDRQKKATVKKTATKVDESKAAKVASKKTAPKAKAKPKAKTKPKTSAKKAAVKKAPVKAKKDTIKSKIAGICDKIYKADKDALPGVYVAACIKAGINKHTASRQCYLWRTTA